MHAWRRRRDGCELVALEHPREDELALEERDVPAETLTLPGTERHPCERMPAAGARRREAPGVEALGLFPHLGVAMDGVDHRRDDATGGDGEPVDLVVGDGLARQEEHRWMQAQRLLDDGEREAEPG